MEKINLNSSETGLVSQLLSKTYNPWETCKYPSITDLSNVEKHQVQVSFTSTALNVHTHQFQEPNCWKSTPNQNSVLHLSLFISGNSDIESYKFSKFHVWCIVFFSFLPLQHSYETSKWINTKDRTDRIKTTSWAIPTNM